LSCIDDIVLTILAASPGVD